MPRVPEGGPPDSDDVLAAAGRLHGVAHRTPVLTSSRINAALDAELFFKCENLQRAGAFKFRGAWNALSRLDGDQRRRGVAAYSSGNHAQAIACAARLQAMPATIVMPTDAPAMKRQATAQYGARIVTYDRYREDREAICQALASAEGLAVIPPFDHRDVIAGQGTAALELFEEVGPLDALYVPLGGGGLLAGTLLAARVKSRDCRVFGVEPAAGDDGRQSLSRGERVRIDVPKTIADGAQTQQLGTLTFPIIRSGVAGILAVEDAALVEQMRVLAETMKLVVEPTSVLGLAGACSVKEGLRGQRVGIILSGGNIELRAMASLLA
jgi:threonine dehydratase